MAKKPPRKKDDDSQPELIASPPAEAVKKPLGRPTKYDKDIHNDLALQLALKGKTHRGIAAAFGVPRQKLYEWADANPAFRDTLDLCADIFADFFESKAAENLIEDGSHKLNLGTVKMFLARFPEYQEKVVAAPATNISLQNGVLKVEYVETNSASKDDNTNPSSIP